MSPNKALDIIYKVLSDAHWGTGDVTNAQDILDALRDNDMVLVELPEPTYIHPQGHPVWGSRWDGPVGDVIPLNDGRVRIQDDYEYEYSAEAVARDAAVLLAAAHYQFRSQECETSLRDKPTGGSQKPE